MAAIQQPAFPIVSRIRAKSRHFDHAFIGHLPEYMILAAIIGRRIVRLRAGLRRTAAAICIVLYLLALISPVYTRAGGERLEDGWSLLRFGWMGLLVLQPAWFANPILMIGVFRLVRGRIAGPILGAVLAPLALSAFTHTRMYSGVGDQILHREIGFWLWEAASILLAVVAILDWEKSHPPARKRALLLGG